MDAHLDGRLRHPRQLRRFGHRQALQLDMHDRQALLVGQLLQQRADVAPRLRGFIVADGQQVVLLFQRIEEGVTA